MNYKRWKEVIELLKSYKIAFIGSKEDQYIEGYDDLRGIDLQQLMNYLAGAKVTIGCSSGVMHLASHCGCPQVVWAYKADKTYYWESLEKRYKKTWNPFNTTVEYIETDNWQPEPQEIVDRIFKIIKVSNKPENKPIKLLLTSVRGRLGDVLTMTTGIRDLKEQYKNKYLIKTQTNSMDVWANNPYLDNYEGKPDIIIDSLLSLVTQSSKTNGLHLTQGTRLRLEEKLNIKIKQGECIPNLHLTKEEKNNTLGLQKPYWIINTDYGNQASETKRWSYSRFQEVVDRLPWITFIQTGLRQTNLFKLKGDNVIDFIDKTKNLRELFSLFYNCEGVVCLVSGNMHLAGAFRKPAVVIAGNNEPVTFEKYSFHRYLNSIGALKCSGDNGCWKCRINGCANTVNGIPKCKDMITSDDVVKAILSYYEGGRLSYPKEKLEKFNINLGAKPKFRVICNAQSFGGAEQSSIEIMKMANERGYEVEYSSRKEPCSQFKNNVSFAKYTDYITDYCEILVFYASDMVFDLNKEEFEPFKYLRAKNKIMAITYRLGKIGEVDWTKKWDKYIFLCSDLENKFLKKFENQDKVFKPKTYVLVPPVDLSKFLKVKYQHEDDNLIRLIRHSSQGDVKYNKNINEIIDAIWYDIDIFKFMPAPSFLKEQTRVLTYKYNEMKVEEFLSQGNIFWYLLPNGYLDNGSRCIVEAMASGLPVIADNWGGAKDRITEDTGWLCENKEDYIKIIKNLTIDEIKTKGKNAREYAKKNFRKEKWIELITKGI